MYLVELYQARPHCNDQSEGDNYVDHQSHSNGLQADHTEDKLLNAGGEMQDLIILHGES